MQRSKVSVTKGKAFDDLIAREALYDGIRATLGSVELIELSDYINDPFFAETAARKLLALNGQAQSLER
jgi:hypothetical protein